MSNHSALRGLRTPSALAALGHFGAFALSGLIAPSPAAAAASASADATASLFLAPNQTVTTVASRAPMASSAQTADVVVFSREELQGLPAGNLADALQLLAGVQVSRTGGTGQPTSVLMRGAAAANTLVLVDGVRMGSATLGQFDFAGLGLAGIERIEMLRGPGATLHGADAVGGVILISTRSAQGPQAQAASVALGSEGSHESSLRLRRNGEGWDAQVQATREASAGMSAVRPGDRFGIYNPDADGFQRRTVTLGGGWSPAAGHRLDTTVLASRLFSRYDSADYPPPDYAPDASPDFATRTSTTASQLSYEWPVSSSVKARLMAGQGEENSSSGAASVDRYLTSRRQTGVQLGWQAHADHRWTLGLDRLHEAAQASGYEGRAQRDNDALVLTYSGQWLGRSSDRSGAIQLQADARQDRNSVYGRHETGRAGLRWSATSDTSLRLQAATSFRAPSFNDLYYPGYGVSRLQPEQGRSLEAGVSSRLGLVQWDATAWQQAIKNLISYSSDRSRCPPAAAYNFGCAANFGQADLKGLTIETRNLSPHGAAPATTWRMGYDFTDATDGNGQALPRRARHQWRAHAQTDWAGWRLGSALLWQSTRREATVALRGGTRVDLQAERPLMAGWSLQARLLNALDADIEPARDYRAPGRQAWLGLRWDGLHGGAK